MVHGLMTLWGHVWGSGGVMAYKSRTLLRQKLAGRHASFLDGIQVGNQYNNIYPPLGRGLTGGAGFLLCLGLSVRRRLMRVSIFSPIDLFHVICPKYQLQERGYGSEKQFGQCFKSTPRGEWDNNIWKMQCFGDRLLPHFLLSAALAHFAIDEAIPNALHKALQLTQLCKVMIVLFDMYIHFQEKFSAQIRFDIHEGMLSMLVERTSYFRC